MTTKKEILRKLKKFSDFSKENNFKQHLSKRIYRHKKKKLRLRTIIGIVLFTILIFLFFINPNLTGFVISENQSEYIQYLNETYSESTQFTFTPQEKGELTSFAISGEIPENATVTIYLDEKIILNSTEALRQKQETSNILQGRLTGRIIENLTTINQTEPNKTKEDEEFEKKPILKTNITQNKTTQVENQTIKFQNYCQETCYMQNQEKENYTIRIEIENSYITLHELKYRILNSIERTNLTSPTKIQTIQSKATINQSVKWTKVIQSDQENEIKLKLPKNSRNIQIYKKENGQRIPLEKEKEKINQKTKIQSTRPIANPQSIIQTEIKSEEIEITINASRTEYEIEYETEPPKKKENTISDSKKEIIIYTNEELNYTNITAETKIKNETRIENIRLFHITNNQKERTDFIPVDENNNTLIEKIKWIVPHLSNQTYELQIAQTGLQNTTKSPTFTGKISNQWQSPENAYESDDTYTIENRNGEFQDWHNFNFNIPDKSTIKGIEITLEGNDPTWGNQGTIASISGDGGFSFSQGRQVTWQNSTDTKRKIGNSTFLWGQTWESGQFSNENFVVQLEKTGNDWNNIEIDQIQATIYFEEIFGAPEINIITPKDKSLIQNETNFTFNITNPSTESINCSLILKNNFENIYWSEEILGSIQRNILITNLTPNKYQFYINCSNQNLSYQSKKGEFLIPKDTTPKAVMKNGDLFCNFSKIDGIDYSINWLKNNQSIGELNLDFNERIPKDITQKYSITGNAQHIAESRNNSGSYYFNGSNFLQLNSDIAQIIGNTSTMSFWIKTAQNGGFNGWESPGIMGNEGSGQRNIYWGVLHANGEIGLSAGNDPMIISSEPINDNTWKHITITRNATSGIVQIYINGILSNQGSSDTGIKTNTINKIGVIDDRKGVLEYFKGYLDDLIIFNRILTTEEIKSIKNQTTLNKNSIDENNNYSCTVNSYYNSSLFDSSTSKELTIGPNLAPSKPTSITCNNQECNGSFFTPITLKCNGSMDPENNEITYQINGTYPNSTEISIGEHSQNNSFLWDITNKSSLQNLSCSAIDENGSNNFSEKLTIPINILEEISGPSSAQIEVYTQSMTDVSFGLNEAPYSTNISIKFQATHSKNFKNFLPQTANISFQKEGEETRVGTCQLLENEIDSKSGNFTCQVEMKFWDGAGSWIINASIEDDSQNYYIDASNTFLVGATSGFIISTYNLTWPELSPSEENVESLENLILKNTGNINQSIKIEANNLIGRNNPEIILPANDFSVSSTPGCNGTNMSHQEEITVENAKLPKGNYLLTNQSDGSEELYFCIKKVPTDITAQDYFTQTPWIIKIFAVLLYTKRKKIQEELQKLKEKGITPEEILNTINESEIEIPTNIFKKEMGALEAITKFLKENMKMSFAEISQRINRDQRTIWTAYKKSEQKYPKKLRANKTTTIPITIFQNDHLTILEAVVKHLRENKTKYCEIAKILNRNQRNIWTINNRANKK